MSFFYKNSGGIMGKLFELKQKALQIIDEKKLDPVKHSGQIGLRSGMMLPFINANTPDDPVKIEQLRKAINSVLDVNL